MKWKETGFRSHVAALTALLVLASMLLPGALAQDGSDVSDQKQRDTSEVTFYGHLFSIGRDTPMPMNTQFPYGEEDLSQGFIAHGCGVDPSGAVLPSCEEDPSNEVWFYTTAGFVQYKDSTEFNQKGYGGFHNERGLTKDTVLDTSKPITATFHMSADMHGWPVISCDPPFRPHDLAWPFPCWQWDPGYLKSWVVKATVYTGILGEYGGMANTAPDIESAYQSGELKVLAEGTSEPVDVQSLEAAGNPTVWKFDIDLGPPQRDVIPKEESYMVRFQWYSTATGSPAVIPELQTWNANGGEYFPPAVRLPVKNAFDVESVIPQFVYDKLVVLGILNTPWGSYDVDQDSIQITFTDQSGNEVEPLRIERLADFSVAHGGHYKPVNLTWVWDYKADNLKPGTYDVTIRASNYQGSASAECTGQFTVREGGKPGGIKVGLCGVQTSTQKDLVEFQQGAQEEAAGGKSANGLPHAPDVGIASTDVEPVPTVAALPGFVAALAVALTLRRRWNA